MGILEMQKKLENFSNLNEQKIEISAKKSAEEQKNKVLRDQIKCLETKIDKITEKERICQVAYAKMETRYGNLEEQIRSSKGENRVLETENLTLKATVNKMQDVMVKTGVFQGNVRDVNEAVSVVEKLFQKDNESRNKIESLTQDIKKLQSRNTHLQQQLKDQESASTDQTVEISRLTQLVSKLRSEVTT